MKKKIDKKQAEEKIEKFFNNIDKKTKEEIRKMKRLAMHYHIRLKEKRKLFCQECYSTNLKVKSVKKGLKTVQCRDCGKIYRWKLKMINS